MLYIQVLHVLPYGNIQDYSTPLVMKMIRLQDTGKNVSFIYHSRRDPQ